MTPPYPDNPSDPAAEMAEARPPARGFAWTRWLPRAQRRARRLRLVETLPMGERRFVAIVAVDGHEYLIGSAPQSLQLLHELPAAWREGRL